VLIRELPTNDIIIEITKGYALKRIGTYSPNVIPQIVHTFVPLNDFCIGSANTQVCLYISRAKKAKVLELATIMKSHHTAHTSPSFNINNMSRLITKDISRILMQDHPEGIIKDNKTIVHFVDDQFHYPQNNKKISITASPQTAIDNYFDFTLMHPTSAELIVEQIKNNKIGFEYLSDTDLKKFLSTIFTSIDTSYINYDVQDILDTFTQLIVGQSVFASRHCSLSRQNSAPFQPCLIVSTLFLRAPTDGTSIYRLIPLPTIFNGDKYIYSNLPKIVGINLIDQIIIMWNDEADIKQCTFSPVVQCQKMPVSMSLSKVPCLSQLFDKSQLVTSMCQVSRSQDIDQDVVDISNGIWLFNNIHHTQYCQLDSTSNELTETIIINEPSLVRMPCDKTITCMDYQLPASSCAQHRIIVTPSFTLNNQHLSRFILPLQNMTKTLLSFYKSQLDKTMKDIVPLYIPIESKLKQLLHEIATYAVYLLCLIVLTNILSTIKLAVNKCKLQRKVNSIDNFVQDMITV
jgi:hypothetical protein